MKTIALDFETFYHKKEKYGIRELGMSGYVRHPRFDPYLISVSDGSASWSGQPKDFNWQSLEGATLLSHNAAFDSLVYAEMVRRGLAPQVQFKEWHCTANMTTYLCMRRDLARACEFLLGMKVDKTVRGDADGKTWADLCKADGGKSMLEYARADALLCWTLFAKFGGLWPDIERRLSALTVTQCQRGTRIDLDELNRQLITAQRALIQADSVLPWIKAGAKPTSPKAVAEECRKVGIPAPPVKTRDGEEAYDEWAALYAPKYEWVKAYTDYRVINKHITTLETVKERLFSDGEHGVEIFPYDLLYFGAHTGRWSGSGGFNMQNMRRDPLLIDTWGRLITDDTSLKEVARAEKTPDYVAHSLDVRRLFIPRRARRMMAPDLSQIEPRVLAWLVNDQVMLDLMARGCSPYHAHAVATMGWTGGNLKDEDKALYSLAKARVLGLGYGCGWEKFITVAWTMAGLDITKDDPELVQAVSDEGELCFNSDGSPLMVSGYGFNSKRTVKDFRESNPLITGLWKQLDEAFRNSVGKDFSITLPSGRVLRYPEVMREWKQVADPDRPGKWKRKLVHTALAFDTKRNSIVRKPFYGGLLCENLVQATARDVFGECLLSLDEVGGINVLWSVHDEAVIEIADSVSLDQVRSTMSKTPTWIPGLPVDCELSFIPHYKK